VDRKGTGRLHLYLSAKLLKMSSILQSFALVRIAAASARAASASANGALRDFDPRRVTRRLVFSDLLDDQGQTLGLHPERRYIFRRPRFDLNAVGVGDVEADAREQSGRLHDLFFQLDVRRVLGGKKTGKKRATAKDSRSGNSGKRRGSTRGSRRGSTSAATSGSNNRRTAFAPRTSTSRRLRESRRKASRTGS
jgi:hypothetical protein